MAERFRDREPRYAGFDVPYTTGSVGVIEGGIADNIVPEDCRFHYEFRNVPGSDAQAMQGEVTRLRRRRSSRRCARSRPRPASASRRSARCRRSSPATTIRRCCSARRLAETEATTLVAFGTEAGLFQGAGIPTVVCGPGHIAQAHQADEYVSLGAARRGRAVPAGADDGRRIEGGEAMTAASSKPDLPATLIPGDGIGPEIVDAMVAGARRARRAVRVGRAAGRHGRRRRSRRPAAARRRSTASAARGLALKGPLTTPVGGGFRSVNVRLREEFQLYANVRPARTLIPGGRYDDIDLVLVRENLEGLYVGFEHYIPIGDDPHARGDRRRASTRAPGAGASPSSRSSTR